MSNKVGTGFISFHTVNDGENAELLSLSSTSSIMTFDSDNSPSPQSQKITIKAKLQNANGTAAFVGKYYNGEEEIQPAYLTGIGNERIVSVEGWPQEATHLTISASLGDLSDTITIVKVKDGARGLSGEDAIVGYLTNESITLSADSNGRVLSFDKAQGTFKVFEGLKDNTGTNTNYSLISSSGATAIIDSRTGLYRITNMTEDIATVDFKVVYKNLEIVKTLSLSKSRQGSSGESAYSVVLTNESHTLVANHEGEVFSYEGASTDIHLYKGIEDISSQVTFSAIPSEGIEGNLVDNQYSVSNMSVESGFVIIKTTVDGLEISKRFNLSKSRNGYTPVKDVDYFDGEDAYSVEIISTEGNIFRNGVIYSTLSAIVKKGPEDITDQISANKFIWQRTSADPEEDSRWNSSVPLGSKTIEITDEDIFQKAIFTCTVMK